MTKHGNPGTDTTINPVIINDTHRERQHDKQQKTTAWAIKAPRGILCDTIGIYEQGVIADFISDDWEGWDEYLKKGYRCVRVNIMEVRE